MITSRLHIGIRRGVHLIAIGILLGTVFNAVRPARLPRAGSHPPVAARYYWDVRTISLPEAWSLHQEGKALFLDARKHASFEEGHLPGAWNIPPGQVKANLQKLQPQVQEGKELIVYCDAVDCPSAAELIRRLAKCGVNPSRVLPEGWLGWVEAGYPVEEGGMP